MDFMRTALDEARLALCENEVPIGAVIEKDGQLLARAHNMRIGKHDPTSHAEIEAIRLASAALGDWRLTGCTMYVTLEPCVMCAGAIVQSRLDTLIFGAFDDTLGCCGSRLNIPRDRRLSANVRVAGGYMERECSELLSRYFREMRSGHSEDIDNGFFGI